MNSICCNEKEYLKPSLKMQEALQVFGMYTFRIYPQDSVVVFSDECAHHFKCDICKVGSAEEVLKELVCDEDVGFIIGMVEKIKEDGQKVSATARLRADGKMYRIFLACVEFDQEQHPKVILGMIEEAIEQTAPIELVRALSDDYESVYYVDLERDEIQPLRLSKVIDEEYGRYFKSRPKYSDAIETYVARTVIAEEKDEMLRECSIENLQLRLKNKTAYRHDYRVIRKGKIEYCRMKVAKLQQNAELSHFIIAFADISVDKERELERYAYIDSLTGGENYVYFKKKIVMNALTGYVVSMDLHDFKIVNSVCGVVAGDECIRGIWKCITKVLDEGDQAGHINADHFAMFFATDKKDIVTDKLNRITKMLEELAIRNGVPQLVPYYGISYWELDRPIELVYSEANSARHEIKNRRDISYIYFSQIDIRRILKERQMEEEFEEALADKRFEIWYQPQISPVTQEVIGAEALVRWRDDEGNLIPPGTFIPIFERDGLIRFLDEFVFRTVCTQIKRWEEQGKKCIPISVNLSRASLYFQNIVEHYQEIVQELGISPKMIPLEITESAAIDNKDIKELADRFFEVGFQLQMDDFGTGYSSLASLNILHFSTLKLDKSLIDYIGDFGGNRLLEHTISLAKELGLRVTAEGVEREDQVKFLKDLNCDSIQGFYYYRPMPLQEFEEKL